jgi:hypothetical protein
LPETEGDERWRHADDAFPETISTQDEYQLLLSRCSKQDREFHGELSSPVAGWLADGTSGLHGCNRWLHDELRMNGLKRRCFLIAAMNPT